MKTIAIVFDGLGYGGIERIGIDYIRMLDELNYKVDVYNLNPKDNALASTLPKSVAYYEIKYPREYCPELYSYGIQKWWWGKYAYAFVSPFLSAKQFFDKIRINKRKYDFSIAISGHINDLSFVAKDFVIAEKKLCWCHGNLISYLAICDAYSILYKKVDIIITLSSAAEKDVYPGRKYLYNKKIIKLYNPTYIKDKPIDAEKIERLKEHYGDYVLMIARAEFRKGYDIAIKAIKRLKEMGIDKYILFAGDGELLNEYKSLAEDEGISSNCVFLGNCPDIQNYIQASYINLLSSRWEGLPTVIIEAMSLGKPCIMTNTDDGEVSHNGEYCKLIEIDDIQGIANAIKEFYTDKAAYEKYCQLSRKRSADFDPNTIKAQLLGILEA